MEEEVESLSRILFEKAGQLAGVPIHQVTVSRDGKFDIIPERITGGGKNGTHIPKT